MGFKYRLEHEIVEEWRSAYIDYSMLKSLIEETANAEGSQRDPQSSRTKKVFKALDDELDSVESFYESLLEEAQEKLDTLEEQLDELAHHRREYLSAYHSVPFHLKPVLLLFQHVKQRLVPEREEGAEANKVFKSKYVYEPYRYGAAHRKLELAMCEYYVYLGSISNYCAINKAGFEKCARKIQRQLNVSDYSEKYSHKIHDQNFSSSFGISDLQIKSEDLYAQTFAQGEDKRRRAAHRLRALTRPTPAQTLATARAGILVGMSLVIGGFGLLNACNPSVQQQIPQWSTFLQIYAAFLLPIILALSVGLDLIIWKKARIDTPIVFSFDRRTHMHPHEYFELPAFLLLTLSICLYLSFSPWLGLRPDLWPLVWLCSTIAIFANPLPIFHYHARWWLVRSTFRLFTAGLIEVEFRDFFLGDQLCSMYYSVYNMYLFSCAYHQRFPNDVTSICSPNDTWVTPILASLPFVLRLGHSIRRYYNNPTVNTHILNISKYGISIAYQYLYYNWRISGSPYDAKFTWFVIGAIANALSSYAWDVAVDWNLLNRNARYTGLRDQLAFSKHWYYYIAIAINLPLRFAWLIYLTGQQHNSLKGFINSFLEVLRRCMWNVFRVESEHVGNVDDFRAVRDVPLPYEKETMDKVGSRSDPPMPERADAHRDDETSPLNRSNNGYGTMS